MADSIIETAINAIEDGRIEDMEGQVDDYVKDRGSAEEILIPLMGAAIAASNVDVVKKLLEKGYNKSWTHPFGDDGKYVSAVEFATIQKTTDPSEKAQKDFATIIELLTIAAVGGKRKTKKTKKTKSKKSRSKKSRKQKKAKSNRRH